MIEPIVVRLLNVLIRRPKPVPKKGTVLGFRADGLEQGTAIVWPDERLREHLFVAGRTGSGKSHSLLNTGLALMRAGHSLFAFDAHGDFAHDLSDLAALCPEAADRLVIFDPTDPDRSPGLNPLDIVSDEPGEMFRRTAEVARLLRLHWGVDNLGVRVEEMIRNSTYVLASQRLTLVDLPLLLSSRTVRQRLVARVPNADIRDFWQNRYDQMSEAMQRSYSEVAVNKITEFINDPAIRHVLGQARSTVDFGSAMQEGKWVIVNLAKGVLGERAHLLGDLLMATLQAAIMARARIPASNRKLCALIIDEVQNIESDVGTLLTEARKFACSVIVSTQVLGLLSPALRAATLATGTQMLFRLSGADAATLAHELSPTHRNKLFGELTALRRGEAIVRVGPEPPTRIRVPALPKQTEADRHRARQLASLSRDLYMTSRSAVEATIAERRRSLEGERDITPSYEPPQRPINEGQADW